MEKYYVKYEDVHREAENLYNIISSSGFSPDVIIAIGTGGFIPARILKSFFKKPIICITIGYYDKNDKLQDKTNKIQWIQKGSNEHMMIKNKKILIVDELDDTRSSLQYVTNGMLEYEPSEIAVGILHNKIKEKKGVLDKRIKYFYSKQIPDKWIIYPWEATDIIEHNKLCESSKFFDHGRY
jgi:hypoxanthine phosphoribosyltransferase